jgi:hypothetical protein
MVQPNKDRPDARPPARVGVDPQHPYDSLDPIPVPDAVESDSDTAWGRWEESASPYKETDTDFQNTVPTEYLPDGTPNPRHPTRKR